VVEKMKRPSYYAFSKGPAVTKRLSDLLAQLPPDLLREVEDFAEFLLRRRRRPKQRKLRQSWAGGLREFRDRYASLDIQRKALEWWGD